MKRIKNNAGGRPPKLDKAKNRLTVNFTDMEHCDFLTMWEKSGVKSKSEFIKARVFGESFRVTTVDKTMMIYEQRLSAFYNQFKAVGVNYNQAVATLKSNFETKKALAMLYKLEQHTCNLVALSQNIVNLSKEFKSLWLQTSGRASR
ncbi:MAG: conjugal transfer protein MobA [Rikenellaceae bacterium]